MAKRSLLSRCHSYMSLRTEVWNFMLLLVLSVIMCLPSTVCYYTQQIIITYKDICNLTDNSTNTVLRLHIRRNGVPTHPWHLPAATWVNTARYCKYSHVLLIMGENIGTQVPTHPWHQPAATWVNITRYCKYSHVLLMMGKNIARNM
jgi:hypothetical protein